MSSSPFLEIDHELWAWGRANSLHLATSYQETEVRSFDVVNQSGTRVQLWVEARGSHVYDVVAWNYKGKVGRKEIRLTTKAAEIKSALDMAMVTLREW